MTGLKKVCDLKRKVTMSLKANDVAKSGAMAERWPGERGNHGRRHNSSSSNSYLKRASLVLRTLNNFMASVDESIEDDHVPALWPGLGMEEVPLPSREASWVLEDARSVWRRMRDPRDLSMWLPANGYLKMWQLQRPNLQAGLEI